MIDVLLIILGILCLLAGLAGCILPALPGPPLAYGGMLLLHFTDRVQFSPTQLVVWLLLVVFLPGLHYFLPPLGPPYRGGDPRGGGGGPAGVTLPRVVSRVSAAGVSVRGSAWEEMKFPRE